MISNEILIYPLEQYMHHRHSSLRKFIEPDVPVISHGRVVDWRPPEALYQALTAVQDKRNRHTIDQTRRKSYLSSMYRAAAKLDTNGMKEIVSLYPDMVPQSLQILALSDDSFRDVAMLMTHSFD